MLLLALVASESLADEHRKTAEYQLGPIVVKAFNPETGEFSEDLSDHSWNQLDLFLLATIEVNNRREQIVEVAVHKGTRVLFTQMTPVNPKAAGSGRYFVPVWISGPFCEDLSIRARIINRPESGVQKTIEFRCGE